MIQAVSGLQKRQAWLFDLDGTVYRGTEAVPGAADVLRRLRADGRQVKFVTNNSRHSAEEISARLTGMGLEAASADVICATEYTGRYLKERYGALTVGVAGSASFEASHRAAGHKVRSLTGAAAVDAVVVGLDDAFNYDKLERIVHAIAGGARLIAANMDFSHPGPGGRIVPETGALVASVEAAAGVRAEFVGKPFPHLFRYALQQCGAGPADAAMVGDNYHTDIVGGKEAGLFTIWLRDPGLRQDAGERNPHADLEVGDMPELLRIIEGEDR